MVRGVVLSHLFQCDCVGVNPEGVNVLMVFHRDVSLALI